MELEKDFYMTNADLEFDKALSSEMQNHSKFHWTPISVIEQAMQWFEADENTRILDVGSGIGKFCIVGSRLSKAQFTGVEKRQNLVDEANKLKSLNNTTNVDFVCSDIVDIDFKDFNAVYYYNPFCEQLALSDWIDKEIELNEEQFYEYQKYVVDQLKKMPINSKVVTFHSSELDISEHFIVEDIQFGGQLILWRRIDDQPR